MKSNHREHQPVWICSCIALVMAVAMLQTGCATSRSGADGQTALVSFSYDESHIYLPCLLSCTNALTFVLDSGFSRTAIGKHAMGNVNTGSQVWLFGISSKLPAQAATNVTLCIGESEFQYDLVWVVDSLPLAFAHRYDGILGCEIFKLNPIEVDYLKKTVRIGPEETKWTQENEPGGVVPVRFVNGTPQIVLELTSSNRLFKGNFVLDTGFNGEILLFEDEKNHAWVETLRNRPGRSRGVSLTGTNEISLKQADQVRAGERRFASSEIDVIPRPVSHRSKSRIAGLVGNKFFERSKRVLFDLPRKRVVLKTEGE